MTYSCSAYHRQLVLTDALYMVHAPEHCHRNVMLPLYDSNSVHHEATASLATSCIRVQQDVFSCLPDNARGIVVPEGPLICRCPSQPGFSLLYKLLPAPPPCGVSMALPDQVGNTEFNYAFQQLGDLTYLWTTPTDVNFTNATNADYYNPGTVYLLNATQTAVCTCRSVDA